MAGVSCCPFPEKIACLDTRVAGELIQVTRRSTFPLRGLPSRLQPTAFGEAHQDRIQSSGWEFQIRDQRVPVVPPRRLSGKMLENQLCCP